MYNWKMTILDVETAFLYGDLKEDIYMKIPAGFFSLDENTTNTRKLLNREFDMKVANEQVCLKLNDALYGLVQAARSWWLKFVNALTYIGFVRGEVDPCLLFQNDKYGTVILILYVDDCLLTGDTLAIESAVNDIKKLFNVTVTDRVEEYLGCKIDNSRKGEITIHQPHIYKHLEDKFEPYLDMKWRVKNQR